MSEELRGLPLSPREIEIGTAIAKGETPLATGRRLHLSPKTISTYRSRILEKMGFKSNACIVKHAIREGWVEPVTSDKKIAQLKELLKKAGNNIREIREFVETTSESIGAYEEGAHLLIEIRRAIYEA